MVDPRNLSVERSSGDSPLQTLAKVVSYEGHDDPAGSVHLGEVDVTKTDREERQQEYEEPHDHRDGRSRTPE